ncbi:phosphodiester glycosidase family protein [Paracoccus sp. (in: a-proteobacteria)]|uniref:phosphodiester glycosidase family protein n=1 Tax=Paracoccus sp. TaxID=267 RepID=UPI0026DFEC5D|nr:phosphodiester glycosidase family protein [Paracoccus sp. (in: a-proteobacteria)]MDO5647672.1 phosphodiester glycosidase family protein [Paracoccus sp. (in: a-proteobacteria)]
MTDWSRRLGVAVGMLVAMLLPAAAQTCERVTHDGQGYVLCRVDAAAEPALRLWQNDATGAPYRNFANIRRALSGEVLDFAMNAGMFHPDYSPVGLLVIDGVEQSPIVTGPSGGNFGMRPNGVFCSGGARPFQVIESRAFATARPDCRLASQSGPMLVIDGALHPRFLPDSTSRYIRNGVGVSRDGQTAWFAISNRPVTFYEFGQFFRDGLGARDALYFDGSISRLYAPSVNRADFGRSMGPVIGLVSPGG